jgi:hypothetical protein
MNRKSVYFLLLLLPMLVHAGRFFAEPSVFSSISSISPIMMASMDSQDGTNPSQFTSERKVSESGGALKVGFCFNGTRERYAIGAEYLTLSPINTETMSSIEYPAYHLKMRLAADAILYNFQFNYLLSSKWIFNLETGIGPGFIHSRGTLSVNGVEDEQQQSSKMIVWQLGVGGAYKITNHFSWTFSADHVDWGNLQLGENYFHQPPPNYPGVYLYSDDYSSTMLMTGLRVYF